MTKSALFFSGVFGLISFVSSGVIQAAELPTPSEQSAAFRSHEGCGPCGCLQVTYESHPEIQSTYGTGYDPRNFDTTQPYFYVSRPRPFPRYSVDGVPIGASCQ
jgi:hypothetical protein